MERLIIGLPVRVQVVGPGQRLVLPAGPHIGQAVLGVVRRAVLDPAEVVADPGADHPGGVGGVEVEVVVTHVLPVDGLVVEDVHHPVDTQAVHLVVGRQPAGFQDNREAT